MLKSKSGSEVGRRSRCQQPLKSCRPSHPNTPAPAHALLQQASVGDSAAWGALLEEHGERLRRMVAFRLDPRLRGRVDAADVVQDAYLEAAHHREAYFRLSAVPLFLWLRGIVCNKLLETIYHKDPV